LLKLAIKPLAEALNAVVGVVETEIKFVLVSVAEPALFEVVSTTVYVPGVAY
jgi:hypothetical protein